MYCFSPKYIQIPSKGQIFLNFLQHLRVAEWQKTSAQWKKTKGSDSYAISSAKFTTEAIATPAVLDTCTAGTMEHDKHPLSIYCSVQADTQNW